jgi:DNA-3-methyladenine glycosylase II
VTPQAVLAASEEQLRSFGLSGQKARYMRAIAQAGALFDDLPGMSDDEAVAHLTAIKGVGRWTAEVYLLFCEGRHDFFPAADIALQEGLRLAEGGEARLSIKALYQRAEIWKPHRGVAALLLWAYYTGVKKGEIIP